MLLKLIILYLLVGMVFDIFYVYYTTNTFNHNNLDAKQIWNQNILRILFGWPILFINKNYLKY